MAESLRPDVLVVGGGIAGSALAVGLHQKGLNVLVVERDAEVRERFRGEYLQPYAAKKMRSLGFGALIDGPETVKIRQLRFRDVEGDNESVSSETLIRYPLGSFAAVLPNRDLVAKIRSQAQTVLGEKFQAGATLEPANGSSPDFFTAPQFNLKLKSGEVVRVRPKWVIGCDGRQSSVRKWMGGATSPAIGPATLGSKPEFIVGAEIQGAHSFAEQYEVIRTHNRGTLAVFRLGENSRRCYWSAPFAEGKNSKRDWDGRLKPLLHDFADFGRLGLETPEGLSGLAGAPADTVWLGPPAKGRFLLTGDALAVTTPFGGQGMTCAMHHVDMILKTLDRGTDRLSSSVDRLGARYSADAEKWFKHVNLLNFALYYLFFAQGGMFKSTTRHILKKWNQDSEILERVGRLFGGDDLDTPGVMELLRVWGLLPNFERTLRLIRSRNDAA